MLTRPSDQLTAALAAGSLTAAPALLGAYLTANDVTLRVVETEAYGGVGEDPASHAHRGRTPRNAPMFEAPGTLYVYFSYGMHWCLNVVCGHSTAAAVLIRACEVVDGVEVARTRARRGAKDHQLASGPARTARVLGIDGAANGTSVLGGGPLFLRPAPTPMGAAASSGPRIGITKAIDLPWRFWLAGSPAVSGDRGARRAELPTRN